MRYFIDESGNSGDLATSSGTKFGGQELFALACVGEPEGGFDVVMDALRAKHQIKAGEIKSSKLYSKKPGFVVDVVRHVVSGGGYFVEVVEKKFFAALHIARQIVFPVSFEGFSDRHVYIHKRFAQVLSQYAPEEVFDAYWALLLSPSLDGLKGFMVLLQKFSDSHAVVEGPDASAVIKLIRESVEESLDDIQRWQVELSLADEDVLKAFLPIPDKSKKDKVIWLLPHYSSLTNILARINLCRSGELSDVKLVHDEQKHFDEILHAAKMLVESNAAAGGSTVTGALYEFESSAGLTFAPSHEEVGIQVADVVAGFMTRFCQQRLAGQEVDPSLQMAFNMLIDGSRPEVGVGLNFVWSHNELQVPPQ